jgi:starch synthase
MRGSAHLRVLSVASECFPLVKTGGLADVVGALPRAVSREGVAMRTLVPGYPAVVDALRDAAVVHSFAAMHGGPARILAANAAGLEVYVLDAPHLFARPGNPYTGADGREWPDNAQRFAALALAGAAIGCGCDASFLPDVVHAHDWQAGLAPAYLHYGGARRPRTVMTVHNLAFQGQYPASLLATLGLPPHAYAIDGVEYFGAIGYLKAGLALADRITTVSPHYAAEIRTPEFGMGLDGLLRHRSGVLDGILNGIDTDLWNPETDPHLPNRFDAKRLSLRAGNKAELQSRLGLARDSAVPLVGVVSRLTWQKGMDLLLDALPGLLDQGAQFALIGSGDDAMESGFIGFARRLPARVAVIIGYDESLAHLMQGGADALVLPSRFEPCGLTQQCALRYGAIPVVARVGGLSDTVVDASEMALAAGAGTGVVFAPVTTDALALALERTVRLWHQRATWHRMQLHAMAVDVGWGRPARHYAKLYRDLVAAGSH